MGRCSATLNRVLMDNKLQRNKWTERDLLKAAQVFFWGRARGFQSARVVEAGGAAQFSIGLKGIIVCSSRGCAGDARHLSAQPFCLLRLLLGHHRHRSIGLKHNDCSGSLSPCRI